MLSLFAELKNRNELLYYFSCFCFAATVFCMVMLFVNQKQVLGINSFIKPLKFFLSSGIYAVSMGWFMYYLGEENKVTIFSWVIITVLAFETIYITLQAARGQLSHFNVSSSFYGGMFTLMGIVISIMTAWTGYIGYLFFVKTFPALPDAYVWSIRLGILFFVIFAFQGGVMGAKLSHTVGAADGSSGLPLVNWSKQYGDLRIAHFVGMHALQVLPLFGYYLSKSVKTTIIFAAFYFVTTTLLLIQALIGRPLIKL
jgi:hypothetical protein